MARGYSVIPWGPNMHVFLRKAAVAVVALAALFTPAAAEAAKPLIVDPAGDANWAPCWVGILHTPFGGPTVCETDILGHRPSEPSVDIVAADFRTRADVLIAEITVFDLDHPGVAIDDEPQDSRFYSMSLNTGGPAIILQAERGGDGTSRGGAVGFYWGGPETWIPTPPVVQFDDAADLVRIEIPFQAINDALMPMCSYCDPVQRGTVAKWPAARTDIWDSTPAVRLGTTADTARTEDTYTIGR